MPVRRIGLTGGIGSGKSTVAAMLVQAGAVLIDTDAIARSLTLAGGKAIAAIEGSFGPALIDASGSLDRAAMRALAFGDPTAKRRLEGILHPLIGQEVERQHAAVATGTVVFDVPLLVESGRWRRRVDRVLVVDASVEVQVERVTKRSAWSRAMVLAAIEAQSPRHARLAAADAVIRNDGMTLPELAAEVSGLWARWSD